MCNLKTHLSFITNFYFGFSSRIRYNAAQQFTYIDGVSVNIKLTSFEDGSLYQLDLTQSGAKRWTKSLVEKLPDGKISLLSELSIAEQQEIIEQLANHLVIQVYLRQCVSVRGFVFWEIFADFEHVSIVCDVIKQQTSLDYLIWPKSNFTPPQLLLFDMDSTFIEIEVIDELAKHHGVGDKVAAVTERAMRGELDFAESLISRVACLKGLSTTAIDEIANNLPVSEGVPDLVKRAAVNHCKVAIVSGGFKPFVEKLKQQMDLYQVHANQLGMQNQLLSGEVEGEIVDAKAKAKFLLKLCQQLQLSSQQVMAIGDGANDLVMMREAGMNLAYRAKPAVVEQALGRLESCHLGRLSEIFNW